MHKILVIRLYFQYTLYMFRTVSVHLQEQSFYKLYVIFGICGYVWLLRCYSNTTARRKKIAPEDGLIQSETCRAYIESKG